MSTPTNGKAKWRVYDDNWFSYNPGRVFRLRRLWDGECMDEDDYADAHGEIPTHALIMKGTQIRHILRCHDGVGGRFFDLMLFSRDEVCTDDVCAAIWGRTIFNAEPWSWEDLVTLFRLATRINMGWLRSEWLP
ncbi:MAG: hypothetical protein E4H07_06445 [Nitrosomonadales bacterium]|nr:MAG: hypothetical protein E4H07_06445 [Nitrosomonadales bacterium]